MYFAAAFFMAQQELISHLFRTEYARIVVVLCRTFGFEHVETAEDIASDTFLQAAETWGIKGLPENPVGWIYTVARNKAKTRLTRDQVYKHKVQPEISQDGQAENVPDIDLSEKNIADSQLGMMFAICNPVIPPQAQVALALRILCGFGIDEIADAFLSHKATVNKWLFRAKEKLRAGKPEIAVPAPEFLEPRLDNVLLTLYLLFNEGYYSESRNLTLQKDLCLEAMRLTYLLTENAVTCKPRVHALLALMCFHASRFEARTGPDGEIILYEDQDRSRWDPELIARGQQYLIRSEPGGRPSRYHFEALIAYWHTTTWNQEKKWENILELYDQLLQVEYSPVAALNRVYAYSRVYGDEKAIREAENIRLEGNYQYHSLLAHVYTTTDQARALHHYREALALTRNPSCQSMIWKKMEELEGTKQD